jgi:uncharacterized protein YndB with AHSA1/START domain
MQTEIRHTWLLDQSPATVWEYLTNSELISQWLMANDFRPIQGHHFMFRSGPAPNMDFDGNIYCEVLEIQPLKKLSYSWKFGPEPGKIILDSIVTWTLVAKGKGTELSIVHSGLREPEHAIAIQAMRDGWDKNVRTRMVQLMTNPKIHETNS